MSGFCVGMSLTRIRLSHYIDRAVLQSNLGVPIAVSSTGQSLMDRLHEKVACIFRQPEGKGIDFQELAFADTRGRTAGRCHFIGVSISQGLLRLFRAGEFASSRPSCRCCQKGVCKRVEAN